MIRFRLAAAALIVFAFLSTLSAPAQTPAPSETPAPLPTTTPLPPTATPAPTPSVPEVLGLCAERKWSECFPAAGNYGAGIVLVIAAVIVVVGFGTGLFQRVMKWGEASPDWVWALFHRKDSTRVYLKSLIDEFKDLKYQPFTGDEVRKPELEGVYLSLDLRAEPVAEGETNKAEDREAALERVMLREQRSRAQLPATLRQSQKHLALIGGAGSGKSTFLHWAGLTCARDYLGQRPHDDLQRELIRALHKTTLPRVAFRLARIVGISKPLFPVFVPLGQFDQFCENPRNPDQPDKKEDGPLLRNPDAMLSFICWRFNRRRSDHKLTPDYLKRKLKGGCLFLFDGVDEVVFERREMARHAVQDFLKEDYQSPRTRALLTSRPPGYTREAWSDDFIKCDVMPMTPLSGTR